MSDLKIIETRDGSNSLLVPEMNETYHSTHGAITESAYVFLDKGLFHFHHENPDCREISILEIGFGTGLNAWLTALESKVIGKPIRFTSLEKFPISIDLALKLNYVEKKRADGGQRLFEQLHQSGWEKEVAFDDYFSFTKREIDIFEFEADPGSFDVIYFDAFAPSRQPEMWSLEVLKKMHYALKKGGVFVTYCAQGQFKRDLKEAGFEVENLDGPPGKKEMTRGIKSV